MNYIDIRLENADNRYKQGRLGKEAKRKDEIKGEEELAFVIMME